MKNTYYKNDDVAMPINAVVTSANGNVVQTSGECDLNNVKVLSLNGIITTPNISDEVILLPLKNGEYVAIGSILKTAIDVDCEFLIESKSGAKLKFYKNGSISINGFTIDINGNIM